MNDQKPPTWPLVLMMIWFGVLVLVSAGMALLGLAFSNEPGGRGNPSIIDYALIFGPLLVSMGLATTCAVTWAKGYRTAAYIACGASIFVIALFSFLFGI